jgi:hypothetical protein
MQLGDLRVHECDHTAGEGTQDARNWLRDTDPVLLHADALDQLVSRVSSWLTAIEGLRNNIRSVAECEKQSAARLRKITCTPVLFAQPAVARGQIKDGSGGGEDTLLTASRGCFEAVPMQMAACHEEIASKLTLLDSKQGKELEKLAKKHKGSIETVVFNVYDKVEKSREDLERKAVALQELVRKGDSHAEVWLLQVQQAAARLEEREASAHYCKQAQLLWEDAERYEAEIMGKMRELMSLFIACQSAAVAKVSLHLAFTKPQTLVPKP